MKPSGPYEPRLENEQVILYLPSTGADGAGCGIGPAWTAGGTVSHPTPASGFTTMHRRTRFTSPAVANQHLGIYFANADHACLWRGTTSGNEGGFFFKARFKVNAIPDTAVRLFVGVSAQTGTGVCTAAGIPVNSVGLWTDETLSGALKIAYRGTGAAATPTDLATTLTAGIVYEFTMIQNMNQNTIVTQLVDLGSGTSGYGTILKSQNSASSTEPVKTAMMAPQVGLGNAAHDAGGDCSFDIISVYCRPNLKLHPTFTP